MKWVATGNLPQLVTGALLLSVQMNQTPGLYVGPVVYPGPTCRLGVWFSFYLKFYGIGIVVELLLIANTNRIEMASFLTTWPIITKVCKVIVWSIFISLSNVSCSLLMLFYMYGKNIRHRLGKVGSKLQAKIFNKYLFLLDSVRLSYSWQM